MFQSIARAATVSMVLHSSIDVLIADWFRDSTPTTEPPPPSASPDH
ncbi:MAG TPA: hypothetical protein VK923_01275 [Euzebyales bacterium]|nr:hypothetical protein [Euzebyales bacterium]